jgi:adenylylsulfate kinase-like enzyme
VAEVARLMNDAGLIVVTAFISPCRDDREMAREIIGCEHFLEVYLSTSLAVCEMRDPKGFYWRARQGGLANFTGVSAPYEEPLLPDVVIDTNESDVECSVESLMQVLKKHVSA